MTIKSSSIASSPKLQHLDISPPTPTPIHQKRRIFSETPPCIGFAGGVEESKEDQEMEYKEYYKDHKPSPLSEIEIAERRKPITRATDGRVDDGLEDVEPKMEEDTADAALKRAERMFREAAERGDPDLPHSRALAKLRALRKLDEFPYDY